MIALLPQRLLKSGPLKSGPRLSRDPCFSGRTTPFARDVTPREKQSRSVAIRGDDSFRNGRTTSIEQWLLLVQQCLVEKRSDELRDEIEVV